MKSLWNAQDAAEILARLDNLSATSSRVWGTMSVSQMLEHLNIAFKTATGDLQLAPDPLSKLASLAPMRWIIIEVMPWPKSLPTAKDFIVKIDPAFENSKKAFEQALKVFLNKKPGDSFGKHPLFLGMPYEQWGKLMYKHSDHHLKQFGV